MSTTKQATDLLPIGARTTKTVGRVTVTLQRTGPTAFYVESSQGTFFLAEWSRQYGTQAEAEAARDHVIGAFEAYGTDAAITARRTALTFNVRDLVNIRRRLTAKETKKLAEIEAEMDSLATLADHAVAERLRADFPASFAA